MEDSGHCATGTALLLNPNYDGGSPLEGCQLGPEARRRALPPWHLELGRRYDPGGQLLSRSSFLVSFRDFGPVPLDAVRCPWGLRAAAHQQLQGRARPGRAAPAAELLGDTADPLGFLGSWHCLSWQNKLCFQEPGRYLQVLRPPNQHRIVATQARHHIQRGLRHTPVTYERERGNVRIQHTQDNNTKTAPPKKINAEI